MDMVLAKFRTSARLNHLLRTASCQQALCLVPFRV
jgi:hypothetical protein